MEVDIPIASGATMGFGLQYSLFPSGSGFLWFSLVPILLRSPSGSCSQHSLGLSVSLLFCNFFQYTSHTVIRMRDSFLRMHFIYHYSAFLDASCVLARQHVGFRSVEIHCRVATTMPERLHYCKSLI